MSDLVSALEYIASQIRNFDPLLAAALRDERQVVAELIEAAQVVVAGTGPNGISIPSTTATDRLRIALIKARVAKS